MTPTLKLEDAKRALRRRLVAQRRALGPEEVRAASREACARLRALPEWRAARTVASYAAFRNEIDPADLLAERGGRRLAFPAILDGDLRLRFFVVDGPSELVPGPFGILGPRPEAGREIALENIDLFVVPGVAFDGAGRRLGLGKGYYDVTLAAAGSSGVRVGFAYGFQVVDEVPAGEHDVRLDLVVTEGSVLRVAPRSASKSRT